VSIEFNNQDSRLGYLNEKLDDLLEGINSSYGEELFNGAEIIHTLMEGNDSITNESNTQEGQEQSSNLDSEIMSEWEKRLEGLK